MLNRSAFFHYCKEERPKLKALNPSLSVGDIAKELGERWNHTAPGDKLIYEEAAQRDKERYEKVSGLEPLLLMNFTLMFLDYFSFRK